MNNSQDRLIKQALGVLSQPELSANFNERLSARLHESSPQLLEPRARIWMRVYWLAALGISIIILVKIDWPGEFVPSFWLTYLSWVLLMIVPFASLLQVRQIRKLVALVESVLR